LSIAPAVCGKVNTEEAKMTGMTPPEFTLNGRCVDWPPITLRPTTRLAYCTGIRRWPPSTKTINATTATIALVFGTRYIFLRTIADRLKWGEPLYTLIYITLILVFAFFYVGIVFNPTELADNMRKNGGFIPGIQPGRTTSEHVSRILKRLTFIGAIYLALVCLLPEWMIAGIHLDHLGWGIGGWFDRHFPVWFLKGLGVQFYFGGTSLLIVVGVAMDTVQQLEAQLVMRNYEGFARKGRLRGRR